MVRVGKINGFLPSEPACLTTWAYNLYLAVIIGLNTRPNRIVMHITGVILAAGTSSRMGSANKLLLPFRNHTVIEEVLMQLSDSAVDDIVVVTGYERERLEEAIAHRLSNRITVLYNSKFMSGRAESIRCAVEYISETADAVLFMVADKPTVNHPLIDRAIERFRKDRPSILYVKTPSGRGHPIIFSKDLFPELLSLQGDRVGNDLIARYRNDVVEVWDEKPQIDIDTEEDYRILLKNEQEK
jgi:molybdenum cofactor cytidylyltransferase